MTLAFSEPSYNAVNFVKIRVVVDRWIEDWM